MKVPYTHIAITFILLILATAPAKAQEWELSETVDQLYEKSKELNDNRKYLQAYSAIKDAQRQMYAEMRQGGQSFLTLDDGDFEVLYWPIMKSMAEIAYKIGLNGEMKKLSDELKVVIEKRYPPNQINGNEQAKRNECLADLAKIDAGYHYLTEEYDHVEEELRLSLALKNYPSPSFVTAIHDELAQLYYAQGKYDLALAQLDSVLSLSSSGNERVPVPKDDETKLETLSQRAICLARLGKYEEALDQIDKVLKECRTRGAHSAECAEMLRKKAKILMLHFEGTGLYDPEAKQCYEEYLSTARKYVDEHFVEMDESEREQYWMAEQPFVTDCYRLEEKAPELLYDVALFSKAILLQMGRVFGADMTTAQLRQALSSIRITWKDVQRALPDTAVAMEFISFDANGKRQLGAVVVTKTCRAPKYIHIAPIDSLTQLLLSSGASVDETLSATDCKTNINALYNSTALSHIIWNGELLQAIGDSRDIYFAPDGITHQIAIEYLFPDTATRKIYRLTSTRLLTEERHPVRTDRMLLCGGVDYHNAYGDDIGNTVGENDELAYNVMSVLQMSLPALPGTKKEIDTIRSMRNANPHDVVLLADSVSETMVKRLMQDFHIIVLATHGYFADATAIGTDIHPMETDTQLSKSCLFLAGAEANLHDEDFDPTHPDGVLSSREIAGLDLSDVDCTVLSACMSGLGYITTDGVFGLQRSLKTAGVKSIIASLWNVIDDATALLMQHFHANLEAGMTLYDAFNNARQTLRETETSKRRHGMVRKTSYDSPNLYDAFILIDGI